MGGFFPQGEFFYVILLAEVKTVVGPEDNDGVAGPTTPIESLDKATN